MGGLGFLSVFVFCLFVVVVFLSGVVCFCFVLLCFCLFCFWGVLCVVFTFNMLDKCSTG